MVKPPTHPDPSVTSLQILAFHSTSVCFTDSAFKPTLAISSLFLDLKPTFRFH